MYDGDNFLLTNNGNTNENSFLSDCTLVLTEGNSCSGNFILLEAKVEDQVLCTGLHLILLGVVIVFVCRLVASNNAECCECSSCKK